jgi:glycine cleavage system pyridoxal-binding protein P
MTAEVRPRRARLVDLADLEAKLDDQTAAVILQSPNFFGCIEQVKATAEIAHKKGALLVVVFSEAVALGLIEPPADADIVCGELQSFAISPSYGGPFAGVMACKEKYLRQMPGRLVGQTTDSNETARLPTVHARATYPQREGDLEHLHEPGVDRANGDGIHDRLRKRGFARTGAAEPVEGALPGRKGAAEFHWPVLQ